MSLNQNQLAETIVQGALSLRPEGSVVSVQIHSSESGTLVPGQAVTIYDVAGGIPKVIAATADTVQIFGFIVYNQKDTGYVAGDACEVAVLCGGAAMYMTASAAIARDAAAMIVVSGSKIALATTNKRVIGRMFDKAAADNDLVRVLLLPFGALAA